MELKIAILFVEKLMIIFQFLILIKRSEMFFIEKESNRGLQVDYYAWERYQASKVSSAEVKQLIEVLQ